MTLSARAVAIIQQLHAKFINLAEGSDDERRALTLKMAQQLRFELGPGWGTKKSGPTNPQSKDAIAYSIDETDDTLPMDVWDWQAGDTRKPVVNPGDAPTYPQLKGQRFIRVQPVNHLDVLIPIPHPEPTPIPPTPQPPTVDLSPVLQALTDLQAYTRMLSTVIAGRLDAIEGAVNADREAKGRVFGASVNLTIKRKD